MAKISKRWLGSARAWAGARRLLARASGTPVAVVLRAGGRTPRVLTLEPAGERPRRTRHARPTGRRSRKPN